MRGDDEEDDARLEGGLPLRRLGLDRRGVVDGVIVLRDLERVLFGSFVCLFVCVVGRLVGGWVGVSSRQKKT